MKRLYEYLKKELAEGKIDHSLRASINSAGEISFYIHPEGRDGDTLDIMLKPGQESTDECR